MMRTPCCKFLRRGEESLSHPLYGWLLQRCTDHVCNETFTATIVFIFKKNRGKIPLPNMTSLHWKIMCSAPLQKMAESFFLGGGMGRGLEKMCQNLRTSKQIIYWHSWLSSCLDECNFVRSSIVYQYVCCVSCNNTILGGPFLKYAGRDMFEHNCWPKSR